MYLWNLDPVAFHLGPLEVRWYGLVYFFGFLLGYALLRSIAKRKLIPNLTPALAEDYVLQLMIASILAARVFYVLVYNPVYYFHNLLEIPAVWHGGLSIHGGLICAVILTIYF